MKKKALVKQSKLGLLRDQITQIDSEIMHLLERRFHLAEDVGEYKRAHELPVEDPHLEMRKRRDRAEFLRKLSKAHNRDIEAVFRTIIQTSRSVQRRGALDGVTVDSPTTHNAQAVLRIALMGSQGSFSEEASLLYAKQNKVSDFELLYPVSAEGVLHLLEVERAQVGIFPIFNSIGGIVEESIYAASEHIFFIEDIFGLEVRQCLHALPGVKKEDITEIMSHPQALAQCRDYLKKNFPKAKLTEASDTATSAKYLGTTRKRKDLAVIAPKRCSELYKLNLLDENIQDMKNNITYFIAASM